MPGNGDCMVYILGAASKEELCAFSRVSPYLEDRRNRACSNRGTLPRYEIPLERNQL
jgi:hypothetical protein